MVSPFCTYTIKDYASNSFFIGANSEKGFILTPDNIFDEEAYTKVFILKGGPGTGKSTFMKKAALEVEEKGGEVIRYYCSSDHDSLDAIVITRNMNKYLIIDGTHPHTTEMKYPGAVSEIINLSGMWNDGVLAEEREKIIELTKEKSRSFSSAYKYISAAAELQRTLKGISHRACDHDKIIAAVNRFESRYKKFKGSMRSVYTEAFSMCGRVAADVYFKRAKEIYYIDDSMGLSSVYLTLLAELLEADKVGFTKLISPVNTEYLTGVYISGAECLVVNDIFDGNVPVGKRINMKRFLSCEYRSYKGRYRFGQKCKAALYEGASECLNRAREVHFQLEDIYSRAMNFRKVSKIYKEKLSYILDN